MTPVDDLDRAIIAELLVDGRGTLAAIGERVGLSAPAVGRRIQSLVARGVVRGFTAVVDQGVLGHGVEAFVELHTTGVVTVERMRSALGPIAEVVEAWTVTGRADTVARVAAPHVAQLEAAVQRLRGIPEVQRTETNLVLTRLIERPAVPAAPPA